MPKVPGIFAIGEKVGSQETKYMYVGRSNDAERRLQEHKSPTPQQHIDKRVAGKFKQHKESDLRIKYVPEQKQQSKEGAYIDCLTKKTEYCPVLNKRAGDGCVSCAGAQKRSTKSKPAHKTGPKVQSFGGVPSIRFWSGPRVGPSGGHKFQSSGSPKTRSSDGASSLRSSSGPKIQSSSTPKMRASGGAPSIRSSGGPKVRSGGRASFRSFGGRRGR